MIWGNLALRDHIGPHQARLTRLELLNPKCSFQNPTAWTFNKLHTSQ